MKKIFSLFIVGIAITLWSCQPQPDTDQLVDQFVVTTNYDPSTNFQNLVTYSIRKDTIGFVSNINGDPTYLNDAYAALAITQAKTNLDALGFERVDPETDPDADPDVAVNIYIVRNLNVFQSVVYGGYGGYSGYYYPYGSYYSYPYVSTQIYDAGVLIIELIDLKNVNANNEVKVVWNAYMGDVFSALSLQNQTQEAIDQAFTQSPYLTH